MKLLITVVYSKYYFLNKKQPIALEHLKVLLSRFLFVMDKMLGVPSTTSINPLISFCKVHDIKHFLLIPGRE